MQHASTLKKNFEKMKILKMYNLSEFPFKIFKINIFVYFANGFSLSYIIFVECAIMLYERIVKKR